MTQTSDVQSKQFLGHDWHFPSIKVFPAWHSRQIPLLSTKHFLHKSCWHLKQVPLAAASTEKGIMQVKQ